MGRLEKLKRQSINEANVRLLNEDITNEEIYDIVDSGKITPQQIANFMNKAAKFFNDDDAVMQAVISTIKDTSIYNEVKTHLKMDPIIWLDKHYEQLSGTGVMDLIKGAIGINNKYNSYTGDFYGGGKYPTIYNQLNSIGVLNIPHFDGSSLKRMIDYPMNYNKAQKGDEEAKQWVKQYQEDAKTLSDSEMDKKYN